MYITKDEKGKLLLETLQYSVHWPFECCKVHVQSKAMLANESSLKSDATLLLSIVDGYFDLPKVNICSRADIVLIFLTRQFVHPAIILLPNLIQAYHFDYSNTHVHEVCHLFLARI